MNNKRKSPFTIYIYSLCIIITSIIIIFYISKDGTEETKNFSLQISMLIFTITSIFSLVTYAIVKSLNNNRQYLEALKIIRNLNVEHQNDKRNTNPKESSDTLELMFINMNEIRAYYKMSKIMATLSFVLSVCMCILGFIIITTSIYITFSTDLTFIESIIPIIGGTVVEVIAGTSLSVYKKSLEQLNQYYESLHNNERFLSLVNLVDKLSPNKRDEIYINIINSQLEVLKNWSRGYKYWWTGWEWGCGQNPTP